MEKKFLDKQGLAEVSKHFDNKYANKNDVPTKLSQLEEDDTHKVVTKEEKETWNKKLDEKSDLGKNEVTYAHTYYEPPARYNKLVGSIKNEESSPYPLGQLLSEQCQEIAKLMQAKQGAEYVATLDKNMKIPLKQIPDEALRNTSPSTFVIASYNSSANSKAIADYVIKYGENYCDVINSYIKKLPSGGGKIQLTEGNFYTTNNEAYISIDEERKYVVLAGYGHSTILERQYADKANYVIKIDGQNNCIENLAIKDDVQTSVYVSSTAQFTTIRNCHIRSMQGVGVTISAHKCNISQCTILNMTNVAILVGAGQVRVSDCYVETLMDDDMGCIQFHPKALRSAVSNCSVMAPNAIGIENMGRSNTISDCHVITKTKPAYDLNGDYSVASNCTGTSDDSFVFAMTGIGNRFVGCTAYTEGENRGVAFTTGTKSRSCSIDNCVGISIHKYAFGINGQNHAITNCVAGSHEGTGFIIGGSGHTLSNCSSTGNRTTSIESRADGATISNCVATKVEGDSDDVVVLSSESKNNWCVGTKVYGGKISNKGTNNTVERTIQLPAPMNPQTE